LESWTLDLNGPIGVFDSGIGGLSVLKQLLRFLPYEKYIYLGDTARVPYGNRSNEIVREYAEQSTEFLLNKNVKLIVVACNTVSSVALDAVKKMAGNIPVIGMIYPASAAALRATVKKKIGIIGTRATINSKSYEKGLKELVNDDTLEVFSKACPLFVPLVEEGMIRHKVSLEIAEEYLQELKTQNIDTLVLGCTHYPLLSQLIGELMPGVELIDSGEHAAVASLRVLADNNALNEEREEFIRKPEIKFYVTDLPALFFENAKRFLGFEVDTPEIAHLE
jgi:glutamate racemase